MWKIVQDFSHDHERVISNGWSPFSNISGVKIPNNEMLSVLTVHGHSLLLHVCEATTDLYAPTNIHRRQCLLKHCAGAHQQRSL